MRLKFPRREAKRGLLFVENTRCPQHQSYSAAHVYVS